MMKSTDNTLVFKTTGGHTLAKLEDFPKGASYQTHFKTKETKTQFVLAHTVYSTKPLTDIKRLNKDLLDYLDMSNVFLNLGLQIPDGSNAQPTPWCPSGQYF
jgi:hypothetical protein